jgi:hypothetical protein
MADKRKSGTVALSSLSALDRYLASQPKVLTEPPAGAFRAADVAARTGQSVYAARERLNRDSATGKIDRFLVHNTGGSPIYYYLPKP